MEMHTLVKLLFGEIVSSHNLKLLRGLERKVTMDYEMKYNGGDRIAAMVVIPGSGSIGGLSFSEISL